MSVIIKNMDKPKCCNACPMLSVEWVEMYNGWDVWCNARRVCMFDAKKHEYSPYDDEFIAVSKDCPIEQEEDDGK